MTKALSEEPDGDLIEWSARPHGRGAGAIR